MSAITLLTGVGVCGSFGSGKSALAAALEQGSVPVSVAVSCHPPGAPDRNLYFARVEPSALRSLITPLEGRRMSPPSRMAVAAARLAIADASLDPACFGAGRIGVSLGTAYGCSSYASRMLDEAHAFGWESASPVLFTETVPNVLAGQLALALQLTGPNFTVTQREASGLTALARADALCRARICDAVLTGVADEMSPVILTTLDRLRMTAGVRGLPARPFDPDSPGCLAAEGACVLIAETEDGAKARGVKGGVRVLAVARANDPSATPRGWGGEPERCVRRLSAEIERAGVRLASIHRIVSGASGVPEGDRAEWARLSAAFGERMPPVSAPKGITGEYGGGFLAAAVMGIGSGERVLVTSAAVGGALVWAVLERCA